MNILKRSKIKDDRGYFLKVMNGMEEGVDPNFGEIYIIKGESGKTRANHYHEKATEWFTLLQGKVFLYLMDIDKKTTEKILLDQETPITVRVDPRVAHSIVGVDKNDYMLLAYSSEKYDAKDTYPFVINELK